MFSKQFIIGMIVVSGFGIGLVVGSFVAWRSIRLEVNLPMTVPDVQIEQEDVVQDQEQDVEGEEPIEYVLFEDVDYAVLSRQAFDDSDPTREVLHVCRPQNVVGTYFGVYGTDEFIPPYQLTCSYEVPERLVMIDRGQIKTLQMTTQQGLGTQSLLKDVRLIDDNRLLLAFEPDECGLPYGLCVDFIDRLFMINAKSGEVLSEFKGVGTIVDLEMLYFSPDMTKYITILGCPEGCPEDVVEGYDLVKKQSKQFRDVIVRGDDFWFGKDGSDGKRAEENYWIDNKTFHLVVRRHQGEEVEVKELDLTF